MAHAQSQKVKEGADSGGAQALLASTTMQHYTYTANVSGMLTYPNSINELDEITTIHKLPLPRHNGCVLPRCYAPPFCDLLSGKRGGGRNNEDLRFRLAVKPPPPPLPRICVLCSAVEDENSFDRHAVAVLKDGRVVGHVHVAKHSR